MIKKIFSNIFLGLKGILLNKQLKPKQKSLLYIDYIKFTLILIPVIIFKIKIKKINIWSFKYTVYVQNYVTFFYIFNEIFCKSIYSPYKINTFLDLGANIGLSTLWYKFFNPNLKVIVFEPDKYNYKILLKNIKVNTLTNVKTYNIALCGKKGIMYFFTIFDNIQNLDSGLTLNQNFLHEKYKVKTDKLSNYIDGTIDLIKMDIEGAEYQVFDDLFKTNKINQVKNMVFEMHFFNKLQKKKIINHHK
jgi:FkbM family methyltransferase